MIANDPPLVSCIMPTYNRRKFIPYAIDYFLRQDYFNKELIIIDDGDDIIDDLIPSIDSISYYRLNKKITLGAKLNMACNHAKGNIIAHWDDDDWYMNTRLSYQVDALDSNTEVCGINNLFYYDLHNEKGYRYIYPRGQKRWLLGSSLCYTKKLWSKNKFADINIGMDGLFVWATPPNQVKALSNSAMSVHMIHENNVSPKKTSGSWWQAYPVEELRKIMKDDWHLYTNGNKPVSENPLKHSIVVPLIKPPVEPVKNIHACLVHENEECILDLVRNLHFQDPFSTILLFNGGTNRKLFSNETQLKQFGAIIHPASFPVKYGYLHQFALSCMQFALDNFKFDTLTIVDSDQLFIRSGYSEYLKQAFSSSTVGMLSPRPKRLTLNDTSDPQVWPSAQAFKEYDLWKPFLQKFENGEEKFVHWTFWPSTVFSADAARDLVKLFKEDAELDHIMKHTKIWATEEVILPTLIALMGYKITENPCTYDFVKFRKTFSVNDIQCAYNNRNVYWMHPVKRQYNDVLRKTIRKNFNYYSNESSHTNAKQNDFFLTLPLLNKLKKIEGWLKDDEADLLMAVTTNMCRNLRQPHTVVDIGCYHGKSTIIFGSVLKKFSPDSKIYAVDMHDGKLGTVEDGLEQFPPSYKSFKKNIEAEGLDKMVESFKDYAYNLEWNSPVSLLLIDGLHDYMSVSKDFWHFADWVVKDGYIAFHDYADYFPGVKAFVDELLQTGNYIMAYKVDTMIILQKV
jgi:glycosyltransferase involved in cell wall biosynthesis